MVALPGGVHQLENCGLNGSQRRRDKSPDVSEDVLSSLSRSSAVRRHCRDRTRFDDADTRGQNMHQTNRRRRSLIRSWPPDLSAILKEYTLK
jgi:hypothetical protein